MSGIMLVHTALAATFTDGLLQQLDPMIKFYGFCVGFALTLYALFSKDNELRKSRNEMFRVMVLLLIAFMSQCIAWALVKIWAADGWPPRLLTGLAMLLYAIALAYFFVRTVLASHLRVKKFKERPLLHSLKHLPIIWHAAKLYTWVVEKRYERTWQDRKGKEYYKVASSITDGKLTFPDDRGLSFLITYHDTVSWLRIVADIAKEHISNGETVTLVLSRHHPHHVISYLKEAFGVKLSEFQSKLVIVDGFTKSFGGDDEVFHKFLKEDKGDGFEIVSAASVPGIHSGAARAFKIFKKNTEGKRLPATVIYDGLLVYRHCLAEDQLVRFLVHMVEAERTYGMLTFLGEPLSDRKSFAHKTVTSLVDHLHILERKSGIREHIPQTPPQNNGQSK